MTHEDYLSLVAEITELEVLLADIPSEQAINRIGLEARLQRAKSAIKGIEPGLLPKKAKLTFRGRPVVGSHGISADFASKASGSFADAFSAIVAGLSENFRFSGPIPDKQKNRLLITGTVLGSFGFEYELPKPELRDEPDLFPVSPQLGPTEVAMEKLEELFRVAAVGTDDEIAEVVDEIHPRAVKKTAEFLEFLSEHEAWCGLEFKERYFAFQGIEQIRSSVDRLKSNNIKEYTEEFTGEFQGVLPKERTFEFKLLDQDGVVRGKVSTEIEDPDVLNREYLHKLKVVTFGVIQVGQGRPRYTLRHLAHVR